MLTAETHTFAVTGVITGARHVLRRLPSLPGKQADQESGHAARQVLFSMMRS
jgi:hypothetical protein